MNMKFACVAAGVPGRSFAEQCDAIGNTSCSGVETIVFPDTKLERWQAEARAAAGGAGLELATVILGGLALHRAGWETYVREAMQAIAELGASVLLTPEYAAQNPLPIFPPHAPPPPGELARVHDAMRAIGRMATDLRCPVYIEPITQFESRFCRCVADSLDLCKAAASPYASIVVDTHNMNITEASITTSIRTAGARIEHMHFADNNRLAPGCGHIDFASIITTLDAISYTGWLSFECAFPGNFNVTMQRSIDWLQAGAPLPTSQGDSV
ncbi:MAG: sugar phosphate isomerase/epimerase [Chloroflexi bacterium]|nr:sugar phosphate isomerase/epimerase [Chloroflexota bacterium]